jgi:hypothetical protein
MMNKMTKLGANKKCRTPVVPPRIQKHSPPPSLDELIAEARAVGWDDVAKSMEKLRYLESLRARDIHKR